MKNKDEIEYAKAFLEGATEIINFAKEQAGSPKSDRDYFTPLLQKYLDNLLNEFKEHWLTIKPSDFDKEPLA